MGSLHELLATHREEILHRWGQQARNLAPGRLTPLELEDQMPAFLRELEAVLRREEGLDGAHTTLPEKSAVAKEHGRQRLHLGFDPNALVREYGLLRTTILQVARRAGTAITIPEFELLAASITSAIAGAVREYTALREREGELPFRLFVASVKDYAIFMLDPNGHVASWNAGAERIKGYKREEILGAHFSKFYTPEDLAAGKPARELEVALASGRYEETGWRVRKDGTRFMADVTITPVHDAEGQLLGFAKITRDVTERQELEAHAERLRLYELFVGALSHDLRNPLTAIQMASQMLLNGQEAPAMLKSAERISRSSDRMGRLIDQLLDLTRLRLGSGLTLEARPTELRELCEHVVEEVRLAHPGRELTLHAPQPCPGHWDPDRLARVVTNLATNAIVHGAPDRPVQLSVSCEDGWAEVQVHNEGKPIPAELQATIFDPFKRADTGKPGLGLGLYISKAIVETHGGTIDVESSESGGTTFRVRLPRSPGPPQHEQPPAAAP